MVGRFRTGRRGAEMQVLPGHQARSGGVAGGQQPLPRQSRISGQIPLICQDRFSMHPFHGQASRSNVQERCRQELALVRAHDLQNSYRLKAVRAHDTGWLPRTFT